jgi:OmcA/MtrC family decaheme c-type cytochrome
MNFKLVKNGTDVVFNTPASTTSTVMMNGFTGTSRVYFTFGAPQDGIVAPNDFNYSANIDLVNAWNQSLDTTTASFTGPVNGYYKLTAKTVFVPATDTILTGAIGLSATFVESGVAGYPGGLQVVVDNVGKTAIGKAGRRPIVDNARCLDCHAQLGIGPTFHSGGRNDGVLCAVCHTPNRTSSGWSASSRSFVHAIHAARFREVPFNWTSTTNVALYGEVEFPNRVNNCVSCHLPGTYAFSGLSEATMASIPYLTVATGNLVAATNAVSPYAVGTVYGSGYSYNAATAAGVVTAAQGNTLVTSPITAACVSCHDSSPAYSHMELNGGMFYNWRSSMPGQFGVQESCMVCHGAGSIADIKAVHGQ